MTTVRKRIADSTAHDHKDAAKPTQEQDGIPASEPEPAKRHNLAGKTALIWPWHVKPGQHVRPFVLEAMEILKNEGWVIGRVLDPDLPFYIIGILGKASVFVKAVKAKCLITNAKETAKTFYRDIKKMQPFWDSDGDNLQFWVFSRVVGLLRYRVYRGGIWNEATKSRPELQEPVLKPVDPKMRVTA